MKSLMKKSISFLVIGILAFAMCMPMVANATDVGRVETITVPFFQLNKVATTSEVVPANTNMTEYINGKKAEFESVFDAEYLSKIDYANLFSTQEGNYSYIRTKKTPIDSAQSEGFAGSTIEKKYEFRGGVLTCIDNITFKYNYTLVNVTKESSEVKEATSYGFIGEANPTYTGGSDGITLRVDADFNLFKNGGSVYCDGSEVPSNDYSASSGSTIINVFSSFLDTLPDGEHTLKVVFDGGGFATTTFNVAKAQSAIPTDNKPSVSSQPASQTKVTSPKTADTMPFVAIAVVFVGLSVAGITLVATRKNK